MKIREPGRARCYGERVIRTVTAIVLAALGLAVSGAYAYVLGPGYAQPTDIAGTLFRFAGSTGTILLVSAAILVAFPVIVGTRLRKFAGAALLVGWALIELGAMAFSLYYDYSHLNNSDLASSSELFWEQIQPFLFIPGAVLLAAGLALFLAQLRKPTAGWIAASIVMAVVGIALLLVVAAIVRNILFAIPLAALLAIILVPVLQRRRRTVTQFDA